MVKKPNDDPPPFKKRLDDGPVTLKKLRDDIPPVKKPRTIRPAGSRSSRTTVVGPGPLKKIRDDVVVGPQFPPVPPVGPLRPGGLSPFLLASGHHAAIAGGADPTAAAAGLEAAAGAALAEAGATVEDARRNVVALQTLVDLGDLAAGAGPGELRRARGVVAGVTA